MSLMIKTILFYLECIPTNSRFLKLPSIQSITSSLANVAQTAICNTLLPFSTNPPVFVGPNEGQDLAVLTYGNSSRVIKLRGTQTGGRVMIMEGQILIGEGPPIHIHTREDESFHVLEGELEFQVGETIIKAKAGQWIYAPIGIKHTFRNVNSTNARLEFVFTPAGIENYFEEIKKMLSCFLLAINSIRVAIPLISLFGSAPTFFILWFVLRLITFIFCPHYIYRRCDDYLYSFYQKFVLFFFENWVNCKIYFHGDYQEIIKKKENVLFISNHQSSVDWIIANMLAVRQGSLGHIRYILKTELKWIPLYGFYFQQHGCIYVRRNDKGDLERVEKGIRQIKSNGLPVWLVIFPEGTRYNPVKSQDVIQRSRQFAKQK
ncbi:unnamed protein product, partial [Rotaria sp. Silwood2]